MTTPKSPSPEAQALAVGAVGDSPYMWRERERTAREFEKLTAQIKELEATVSMLRGGQPAIYDPESDCAYCGISLQHVAGLRERARELAKRHGSDALVIEARRGEGRALHALQDARVEMLNLRARLHLADELADNLAMIERFVAAWDARPFGRGIADELYGIHGGDSVEGGASLYLSKFREISSALAAYRAKEGR
jgi:hypothetical protein